MSLSASASSPFTSSPAGPTMASPSNHLQHYPNFSPSQEHPGLADQDAVLHAVREDLVREVEPLPLHPEDGDAEAPIASRHYPTSVTSSSRNSTPTGVDPKTVARLRPKPSTASFESDSSFSSAQSFHTVAGSFSSMASQTGDRTPTQGSYSRSSIYRRRDGNDAWESEDEEDAICGTEINLDDLEASLSMAGHHLGDSMDVWQSERTTGRCDEYSGLLGSEARDFHARDTTVTVSRVDLVDSEDRIRPPEESIQSHLHTIAPDPIAPQPSETSISETHENRVPTAGSPSIQSAQPQVPTLADKASPSMANVSNTFVRPRSRRLSAPERISVASMPFDRSPLPTPPKQNGTPGPCAPGLEVTEAAQDLPSFHTSLASTISVDQTSSSDLTSHKTFSYHRRQDSSQTTDSEMDLRDEMRQKEPLRASAQHAQTMLTMGLSPSLMQMTLDSHQPSYPVHHDYRQGVVFEYFEGEWDWLPNFDEMRPTNVGIVGNFLVEDTTEIGIFRPKFRTKPSGPPGNFAVRFTTNIDIRQDGVYTFWLNSNDGSTLYIANQLVVENDGTHYATEVEGRIMLTAGKHPMLVEFFHKNGKMLEGFRSTGPSLSVHYRPPGPIWSFGLTLGPKQVINSMNLFYDHGDLRTVNLLNKFSQEVYLDPRTDNASVTRLSHDGSSCYSPQMRPNRQWLMSGDTVSMQPSTREMFVQMENSKATIKDLEQIIRDQAQSHQKKMDELYAILQETMAQKNRLVQGLKQAQVFNRPWTNATPSQQPQSSSSGLTGMNGGMAGSASAARKEALSSSRYQTHSSSWRNTVASVYVDAQEGYSDEEGPGDLDGGINDGFDGGAEPDDEYERGDNEMDSDLLLERHLAEVDRLKQLYFFSMALSVKMNTQMKLNSQQQIIQASQESVLSSSSSGDGMNPGSVTDGSGGGASGSSFTSFLSRTFTTSGKTDKQSPQTTMSLQKLYEDCCSMKIPVESWPAYVSRTLGVVGSGGPDTPLNMTATNLPVGVHTAPLSSYPQYAQGLSTAATPGTRSGGVNPGAAVVATTSMPVFVIL